MTLQKDTGCPVQAYDSLQYHEIVGCATMAYSLYCPTYRIAIISDINKTFSYSFIQI